MLTSIDRSLTYSPSSRESLYIPSPPFPRPIAEQHLAHHLHPPQPNDDKPRHPQPVRRTLRRRAAHKRPSPVSSSVVRTLLTNSPGNRRYTLCEKHQWYAWHRRGRLCCSQLRQEGGHLCHYRQFVEGGSDAVSSELQPRARLC